MARGVNKVILVGNLGADPETRAMPSGSTVANLRIATSESWRDKTSGEQQERTEWHRVALFGRLAEIASEYLKKGSQVYIEGSLRTRKWQDKQGQERFSTEIVANELQMLGGRGGAGGGGGGGGGGGYERSGSSGGGGGSAAPDPPPPPEDSPPPPPPPPPPPAPPRPPSICRSLATISVENRSWPCLSCHLRVRRLPSM